jgi:hypothetical protein
MKRLVFFLGCSGALLCAADLPGVHNLYVMPMSRGLDQYLASRIASEHLFQVVTDPKLADAVLSDRVGETLQAQLETIFPTPKPPEPEPVEKADSGQPAAKSDKSSEHVKHPKEKEEPSSGAPSMFQDTVNKLDNPAQTSTFGRSKGNIFLVDTKSRQVIWSTYDPPKGSATRDLDRTAFDIVSRLKKDLYPKKK